MNIAYLVLFIELAGNGYKLTSRAIKWATIIGCAEVLSVVLDKLRKRDTVNAFKSAVKEAVKNKETK